MREESAVRRFPAQLKNLAKIRRFVSEVAARVGMTADAISDVLLAVDEATTNIITHGYEEPSGEIDVEVRRAGNSCSSICVTKHRRSIRAVSRRRL